MPWYTVKVREVYEREAYVEAESKAEAKRLVRDGQAADWGEMEFVRQEVTNEPVKEGA
jgi:hypothetical protein